MNVWDLWVFNLSMSQYVTIYVCGAFMMFGFFLWDVFRPRGWVEVAVGHGLFREEATVVIANIIFWPMFLLFPIVLIVMAIIGLVSTVGWLGTRIPVALGATDPFAIVDSPWELLEDTLGNIFCTMRYHGISLRIILCKIKLCKKPSY